MHSKLKLSDLLEGGWVTHNFAPFDPVSKRITAEVEKDGKRYTAAKGAPNAYGTISLLFSKTHNSWLGSCA